MKWRATFALETMDATYMWSLSKSTMDRFIESDDYDTAVTQANAMVMEEISPSLRLSRLMFIEFVDDLTEAEERVVEIMKRFETFGF